MGSPILKMGAQYSLLDVVDATVSFVFVDATPPSPSNYKELIPTRESENFMTLLLDP